MAAARGGGTQVEGSPNTRTRILISGSANAPGARQEETEMAVKPISCLGSCFSAHRAVCGSPSTLLWGPARASCALST